MKARRFPRRQVPVIGYESNPDGWVSVVEVRCPFCGGRHRHATARSWIEDPRPYCGTPGVGYTPIWSDGIPARHQAPEDSTTTRTNPVQPKRRKKIA